MAARYASRSYTDRCSMAVACSSARIRPILDTAILLVVSIFVLSVRILLYAM